MFCFDKNENPYGWGKSYKVENNIIKLENIMENINISIKCSSENDVFENLTISKLIVFIIIIVCSIIAMIFIIKLITKFINKKQE